MLSFHFQLSLFVVAWPVLGYRLAGIMHGLIAYLLLAPPLAAAAVALVAAIWQVVYYRYLHPLAKFPGPFWACVTRLWLARVNIRGREAEELLKLHEIYGPVVRISPTMLSIAQASMLPRIYHREADKTEHYTAFVKGGPESFFNIVDHKAYVKARKLVGKPFTPTSVKAFEPFVDAHISHWIKRLTTLHAETGQAFDFAPWATYLGFDVITDLAFGQPMGFIAQGVDVGGLIKGLHTGWLLFGLLSRLHPVKSYMASSRIVKRLFTMKPSDKTGFGVLMKTRDRIIEERTVLMNEGKTDGLRRDMLQGLLEARDENGTPLDIETIKQEALVILIAGADTVGTTLQGVLMDLLQHPRAMARCVQEIEDAFHAGKIGSPPTVAQIQEHCPFFFACLRETLRVHPSAPGIFPRLVGKPGLELGGLFVPHGTEVAANIWVVARDKSLYGADAGEWRPERWFDNDEGTIREMNRLSMSWGFDRACLGKEVALMELCKAGCEVLRRFDWEIVEEEAPKWIVKAGVGWWENVVVRLKEKQSSD